MLTIYYPVDNLERKEYNMIICERAYNSAPTGSQLKSRNGLIAQFLLCVSSSVD